MYTKLFGQPYDCHIILKVYALLEPHTYIYTYMYTRLFGQPYDCHIILKVYALLEPHTYIYIYVYKTVWAALRLPHNFKGVCLT